MKFKSKSANLIVWDPQKGKELCRFKDFELETDEQYIIDRLDDYDVIGGGREEKQKEAHTEEQEDKEQQVKDLREEAKEKGIRNWHNMKPENLKKKLRGD